MKKSSLGPWLLLLVACTHFGYDPLAQWLYPAAKHGPAALFYVLRGVEGAVLYVVILWWSRRSIPVVIACAWGALENAQTAVCRVAAGIERAAQTVGPGSGICDFVTGAPIYGMTAVLALVAAAVVQESK